MKKYLCLVFIVFISCEKEEIPISPHTPGNVLTNQIELGIDYRYQVFYDLPYENLFFHKKFFLQHLMQNF